MAVGYLATGFVRERCGQPLALQVSPQRKAYKGLKPKAPDKTAWGHP
jgi:hypothetical protein